MIVSIIIFITIFIGVVIFLLYHLAKEHKENGEHDVRRIFKWDKKNRLKNILLIGLVILIITNISSIYVIYTHNKGEGGHVFITNVIFQDQYQDDGTVLHITIVNNGNDDCSFGLTVSIHDSSFSRDEDLKTHTIGSWVNVNRHTTIVEKRKTNIDIREYSEEDRMITVSLKLTKEIDGGDIVAEFNILSNQIEWI